jgi:hypothetical protein
VQVVDAGTARQLLVFSGPHEKTNRMGIVNLAAGTYPFEVQFFEDFGMPADVDLTLP